MAGDLPTLLFAVLVLVALTVLMRWVFKPSRPRQRAVPMDAAPGLLESVATGVRRGDALALRATLGDADIRSSMSTRRDGTVDVMVFRDDVERARALLPPV